MSKIEDIQRNIRRRHGGALSPTCRQPYLHKLWGGEEFGHAFLLQDFRRAFKRLKLWWCCIILIAKALLPLIYQYLLSRSYRTIQIRDRCHWRNGPLIEYNNTEWSKLACRQVAASSSLRAALSHWCHKGSCGQNCSGQVVLNPNTDGTDT